MGHPRKRVLGLIVLAAFGYSLCACATTHNKPTTCNMKTGMCYSKAKEKTRVGLD